jgi:hypothetical protein
MQKYTWKRLVVLVIALFAAGGLSAQLSVSQASALAMVDYLVDEESGTVEFDPSSISFTGSASMLGQFNGINTNLGLSEGVIMSTGRIQNAVGPNDDDGFNGNGEFNLSGTTLLDNVFLSTSGEIKPTFDAAILRFNFRVLGDLIKFRYVFASEEYNEFVCSGFNDAFAFFISGESFYNTKIQFFRFSLSFNR